MKVLIVLAALIHLSYGLSQSERDAVVQAHNNFRSQLANGQTALPNNQYAQKAKNMYKIVYNPSIEAIAQAWANNCQFGHNPNRGGNGENIYGSSGNIANAAALTGASGAWWSEFKNYGGLYYQNGNALVNQSIFMSVGHATQMGWARTTQIGCGVAKCASFPQTFVVCNYYEPGNNLATPVYQVGNPCTSNSQCTTFANSVCDASVGLCDISNGQQTTTLTPPKTSTSTKTTTSSTTPRPTCADKSTECSAWIPHCKPRMEWHSWMVSQCRKTCDFCDTPCQSDDPQCKDWLDHCVPGTQWHSWMVSKCSRACGFCCADKDATCSQFTAHCQPGQAKHQFMIDNCKKTCGFCEATCDYDQSDCGQWLEHCVPGKQWHSWMVANCGQACGFC